MKQRKLTLKKVQYLNNVFCACKNLSDLSLLFRIPKKNWVLWAFEPMYYHFSIQKPNGKMRHIEAPEAELKQLQRTLNHYLQMVYYQHQSNAAYGFLPKVLGVKNVKNMRIIGKHKHDFDYICGDKSSLII